MTAEGYDAQRFDTPKWSKGAIMYQIFVDRFYNGNAYDDVRAGEYEYLGVSTKRKYWDDLPEDFDVANFCGGDLEGVIDKLDYLMDLGVEVIYLNPIFSSPSNHKYDTQDYYKVDEHFGGNAVFERLCKEVHRKGMRIILDGVFNHCSNQNPWMTEKKEYFRWGADGKPECWWGNETLPKLNYDDCPELVDEVMEIAKFWLKEPYCIDGWRLDVAADLGHSEEFNHQFWKRFRREVKSVNPDALILAEHYGDASAWLKGDEWDSVMNYDGFMEPVSYFITGMEKHSDAYDESAIGDGERFRKAVEAFESGMQRCSVLSCMNELDNHDHSRFLTRTNRVTGRLATKGSEAAEGGTNICFLRQAQVIQFTLGGAPTVYYGDEAGVEGFTDPDSRRPYPWGEENVACLEFTKYAAQIHKMSQTLKTGGMKWITAQKNLVIYARTPEDKGETVIIAVYTGDDERDITIPTAEAGLKEGDVVRGVLYTDCWNYGMTGGELTVEKGCFTMRVKPHSAYVLTTQMRGFGDIEYDHEEFAKCMRGERYNADFKGRNAAHQRANDLCWEFNNLRPSDEAGREAIIRKLFGKVGEKPYVEPFIWVGFGFNIEVGDRFFANNCCNFMDPGKITFGNDVYIGPDCGFYTAHHPTHWKERNDGYEWAKPITVGDNVWFGGHVTVCPGVTIGSNVVIGAGSVVVHDIPDNCVACGNPCEVKKPLPTDEHYE